MFGSSTATFESYFPKNMVWQRPLVQYVYKKDFQLLQFHVSQAPSRYYGLVCAVCFHDLLQNYFVTALFQ